MTPVVRVREFSTAVRHRRIALVAALWLSAKYLFLGPSSWMYGYGAGLETIPTHLALIRSQSVFSLWAPSVAGGLDRLAFWGNADPLSLELLLFTLLPTWPANGLHMFLQRFVAIYFAARVAEEQLGMDGAWSTAAGLLHGGLTYFSVGDMMALPGVPLALWLIQRLAAARSWPAAAFVGGMGFSIFTAFSPAVPYLLLFAAAWFWIVDRRRSARFWVSVLLFALGLCVADSPQLVAALHNAPFSHRAGWAPELPSLSLEGLFYYEPQFDFLDQDKALKAVAVRLPWLILAVGVVLGVRERARTPMAAPYLRVALIIGVLSLKVISGGGGGVGPAGVTTIESDDRGGDVPSCCRRGGARLESGWRAGGAG